MTLTEKAAYLKGFADAAKLEDKEDIAKLLGKIIDLLDDLDALVGVLFAVVQTVMGMNHVHPPVGCVDRHHLFLRIKFSDARKRSARMDTFQ